MKGAVMVAFQCARKDLIANKCSNVSNYANFLSGKFAAFATFALIRD